jgi:hypothetical protein
MAAVVAQPTAGCGEAAESERATTDLTWHAEAALAIAKEALRQTRERREARAAAEGLALAAEATQPGETVEATIAAMGERWRPVVGYEQHFAVSDRGRVLSLPGGLLRWRWAGARFKRTGLDGRGYRQVLLFRGGQKARHARVHSLVLEAFVGARPAGHYGVHLDRNLGNNRLENLAYLPGRQAVRPQRGLPLVPGVRLRRPREEWANTKLSDAQVADIRLRLMAGERGIDLAREYGVHEATVSRVRNGSRRLHAP